MLYEYEVLGIEVTTSDITRKTFLSTMMVFSTFPITFIPCIKYFVKYCLQFSFKCSNTVATGRKCFWCLCITLYKIMLQQSPPYENRSIEAPVISYSLLNTQIPLWKHKPKTPLHRLPWNQCTLLRTTIFFVPKLKTWIRLSRLTSLSHNSSHTLCTGHCCESILQILYNLQTTKLYASRKPPWCMFLLRLQKAIRTNTGGKGRWKAQGMNDQNGVNEHKQFTERERNFMARGQPECMSDPCGDLRRSELC